MDKPYTITIMPGERITAAEFDQLPPEPEGWKRVLVENMVLRMPETASTEDAIADLMRLGLISPAR